MAIEKHNIKNMIYIIIGSASLILNLAEVVIIKRGKKRLKPHDKLLLSLAVADLLIAITVIICKVINLIVNVNSRIEEETFSIVLVSSLKMSILCVLAITFDRFVAVRFPLKHLVWASGFRINMAIGLIWAYGISMIILTAVVIVERLMRVEVLYLATSLTSISVGIIMKIMYFFIMHTSCISRTLTREGSEMVGNVGHCEMIHSFFSKEYSKERHMFFTCWLIFMSYIVCSYPFAIEFLWRRDAKKISQVSQILLVVDSALNPVVYFFKGYLDRSRRERVSNAIEMNRKL